MNKSSSKTTNQQQQQNQRRKKTNKNNNEISKNNNREKFSSNIFLSANCKFLVLDSSDALKECLQNADKTLPLEDIVRLELVNKGEPGDKGRIRCPICLEDPPKFPVVNPCGHVVCSACAQELVARNREFEISSVCPVCLEMPFVDADLRSCVLRTPNSNGRAGTDDDCKVGDRLTFELFERDRDSLATRRCVMGKKSVSSSSSSLWPRAKADEDFACDRYSKYTTISIDEVKVLSEEEVEALEREASENAKHLDRDSTLYCFVAAESAKKRYNMFYEKCGGSISSRNSGSSAPFALCNAIEKTRAAMETAEKTLKIESAWPSMMKNSAASPLAGKMNWATKQSKTTTPSKGSSEVVGASAFARSEVSDDDDDDAEVEEKEEKDASAASSIDASKKYYFYQSSISEKVVLHPVCMKAILSAHGDDFSRIPRKIKVILLEIEKTIVDDAVRNRNPQWRHYSKTTELLVCEGDLREICDRETLNKCEQIIKRAARRKTDEAKKKKEDKKEREKERKLEKERVEKEMVFARDILHRMPKLGHENDVNEKEMDDIFSSSPHQQHQQQQQNFANVAKFGFGARFHDMPSLAPDASSTSAFPSLGEPATMSASKSPNWAQPARMEHIDFDSALSKSNEEMVTTTTTNGGKKKKNSKGTPLFSSSVGRRRV
ncbi:unnamed protein product [Bathycoccus prasinos]|jgi:hypothetical protein